MRLIDADALADALFEKRKDYPQWVADTIGNMPDAVVRCKDCTWFIKMFENEGRCIKHDNDFHELDWFCADGERKN